MDYFEVIDRKHGAIVCSVPWDFFMEFIRSWGFSFVSKENNQLWVSDPNSKGE